MFEKIKFWQKKESTDLDGLQQTHNDILGQSQFPPMSDPAMPGMPPEQQFGYNPYETQNNTSSFGAQQQFPTPQSFTPVNNTNDFHALNTEHQEALARKDIELILAKLETIKVSLDNLSHRVERIEQQKPQQNRW